MVEADLLEDSENEPKQHSDSHRRMLSYEVFKSEYWPRLSQNFRSFGKYRPSACVSSTNTHRSNEAPTLVYSEIIGGPLYHSGRFCSIYITSP